jgi:hypothetical protein
MRATILAQNQRSTLKTGHDNVRLERFREHTDDRCELHNIDREVQIQRQVVLISAYETPVSID